jgi:hypothetical protein
LDTISQRIAEGGNLLKVRLVYSGGFRPAPTVRCSEKKWTMNFGVPKEVREFEERVGLTPAGAHALVSAGHRVYLERNAGAACR